jgi:small conductance mechanosensitive channel
VALGLGAQLLIRDVINGMFILIEDQYAIGDTVSVAGVTGEVIDINPRRTVIRDEDGNVHSIPNSSITVATNKTSGLNRFVVEVQVPFRENERAVELIAQECAALFKEWPESLVAEPRIIEERAAPGSKVLIRVAGDARGARKWSVEARLRASLVSAFESESLAVEFERSTSAEDSDDATLTKSAHRVSYVSPNPPKPAPSPPPQQ